MSISEGTTYIVLGPPNANWIRDQNRYWFPLHQFGGFSFQCRKVPPQRLLITVSGLGSPIEADLAIPDSTESVLVIAVAWTPSDLRIYLSDDESSSWMTSLAGRPRIPDQPEPVKPEHVYLQKIGEMQIRAGLGTYYDLVMASAILRHLLLDADPLVHRLNRDHKLRLGFEIAYAPGDLPPDIPAPAARWLRIDPKILPAESPNRRTLSLKGFLATICLVLDGQEHSVHDIIASTANIRGGVHFGVPDAAQEGLIGLDSAIKESGVEASVAAIRDIVEVAHEGLKPLTEAVFRKLQGR